ncbi:MAG: hypothetical protein KC621_22215, partial [Myxococcales bacterium]|nr:hypothetical protein [Myxococcales bacterium]
QQHRWMKGGAQVARKLLGPLWRSSLPFVARVQGTVHLCGGMVFGAVVLLCLITPVLPQVRAGSTLAATLLTPAGPLLQGVLGVLVLFYGTSCWRREPTGALALRRLLTTLPTFLVLSTGMALHNAAAVVEGWSGVASPFVRTPKRGDSPSDGALYAVPRAGLWPLLEGALAAWGAWGAAAAVASGEWVSACFLASQALGFGAVALGRGAIGPARPPAPSPPTRPSPSR